MIVPGHIRTIRASDLPQVGENAFLKGKLLAGVFNSQFRGTTVHSQQLADFLKEALAHIDGTAKKSDFLHGFLPQIIPSDNIELYAKVLLLTLPTFPPEEERALLGSLLFDRCAYDTGYNAYQIGSFLAIYINNHPMILSLERKAKFAMAVLDHPPSKTGFTGLALFEVARRISINPEDVLSMALTVIPDPGKSNMIQEFFHEGVRLSQHQEKTFRVIL